MSLGAYIQLTNNEQLFVVDDLVIDGGMSYRTEKTAQVAGGLLVLSGTAALMPCIVEQLQGITIDDRGYALARALRVATKELGPLDGTTQPYAAVLWVDGCRALFGDSHGYVRPARRCESIGCGEVEVAQDLLARFAAHLGDERAFRVAVQAAAGRHPTVGRLRFARVVSEPRLDLELPPGPARCAQTMGGPVRITTITWEEVSHG